MAKLTLSLANVSFIQQPQESLVRPTGHWSKSEHSDFSVNGPTYDLFFKMLPMPRSFLPTHDFEFLTGQDLLVPVIQRMPLDTYSFFLSTAVKLMAGYSLHDRLICVKVVIENKEDENAVSRD
jgi:hypothetical protein